MQINEQELADAVERLREGEQVMGVTQECVFKKMIGNHSLMIAVLEGLHEDNSMSFDAFHECFDSYATDLLREAYRTKLEHEAGL